MTNPVRMKILTEEALYLIKENLNTLSGLFSSKNNDWIKTTLGSVPFAVETKYDFERFDLVINPNLEPSQTEAENVERVYGALKDVLSPSEATDERLWAWFCLDYCFDFVKYRWKIKPNTTASVIESHYFFQDGGVRRALNRNAIARLWWLGYYTYDENEDDPYTYTKWLCQHADYILHIIERNLSSNPKILKAFIRALMDAEKEGYKINTDAVGSLQKHMIALSGTFALDFLSESDIIDMILKEVRENKLYGKESI